MSTTTNLSTLKINYLTQSQYDTALANNQINENEIYLTPTEDMTAQEVDNFVNSLDVSGSGTAVDIVVDQGISGIWLYRKWNSGIYEAWGNFQASSMTLTTASGGTYYGSDGTKEISLPSWSTECIFASGMEQSSHSSGVYIYNITKSASKITIDYRAHASTSNAMCGGCFYIMGQWQ